MASVYRISLLFSHYISFRLSLSLSLSLPPSLSRSHFFAFYASTCRSKIRGKSSALRITCSICDTVFAYYIRAPINNQIYRPSFTFFKLQLAFLLSNKTKRAKLNDTNKALPHSVVYYIFRVYNSTSRIK
jgi:hypothetical protein